MSRLDTQKTTSAAPRSSTSSPQRIHHERGDGREREPDRAARETDEDRFGRGETGDRPGGQPASAQQRLLVAAPLGSPGDQRPGEQGSEDHAREAEEEEEHLRVCRVGPRPRRRSGCRR